MDVWTLLRICARRWYVFVPMVALALWQGYTRAQELPPLYTTTSSAVLVGPALVTNDKGEVEEINPFQNLGGSLVMTAQIAVSLLDSEPTRLALEQEGIAPDYEVSIQDAILYFDVVNEDEDEVIRQASALLDVLDVEIARLQDKSASDPDTRIRAVPLSVPTLATEDRSNGLQLVAIVGVLGLVAGVCAAVVVEGLVRTFGARTRAWVTRNRLRAKARSRARAAARKGVAGAATAPPPQHERGAGPQDRAHGRTPARGDAADEDDAPDAVDEPATTGRRS